MQKRTTNRKRTKNKQKRKEEVKHDTIKLQEHDPLKKKLGFKKLSIQDFEALEISILNNSKTRNTKQHFSYY
jgi:hypothetical protein